MVDGRWSQQKQKSTKIGEIKIEEKMAIKNTSSDKPNYVRNVACYAFARSDIELKGIMNPFLNKCNRNAI